jgi:predicted DNA-binding transcriptional regulator AlpA
MRTLMTKKQVAALVRLHPESIMRLARMGKFPKPIRIGDTDRHAVRFLEEEIDAWLRNRMIARELAS